MGNRILAINPGSTSSKVSYFEDEKMLFSESINHDSLQLEKFEKITDQFDFRKEAILDWFHHLPFEDKRIDGVVGRGGLLRPMPSGTYFVTEKMQEDLRQGVQGEHASNLGGLLAKAIADDYQVDAFIVDPVSVDEFHDVARISGLKEVKRKSLLHALNVRATSLRYCKEQQKDFSKTNLVVAHLGGGISVVAIKNGTMVDTNDANEMGPFSPERTGSLPMDALAQLLFSGKFKSWLEAKTFLRGKGGVVAYLGTNDMREVEKRVQAGDITAKLISEAMAYQIGKEIGSQATVLNGKIDAILITGGIAYNHRLMEIIKEMVSFIADVYIYPGEDEMESLALGCLRVLKGSEKAKDYDREARFD